MSGPLFFGICLAAYLAVAVVVTRARIRGSVGWKLFVWGAPGVGIFAYSAYIVGVSGGSLTAIVAAVAGGGSVALGFLYVGYRAAMRTLRQQVELLTRSSQA